LRYCSGVTKAKRLRELMFSKDCTVLMEAHNGLTAKLVEEAGFEAIWGSGLSISAGLGVRDSNEASWTQVLEVLEFMNDATTLPILLDGDTGYGNFNNARRLVNKLEQRGIAGVCLEDKLFPKTNSFIDGEKQALADVDEFCGKLRAAKDAQQDPDFVIVARTEAFIAGWGLQEALLRATAYSQNGADVILVHSKRRDSKEIMEFMDHWKRDVPVVIVPTKYPSEPVAKFRERGIHNFIFANHTLRTVITSVQRNLQKLRDTTDLMSLESEIVPVSEIFRLQNVDELKQSEELYLPDTGGNAPPRGLILAATKGNFGDLVKNKPKVMLNLRGKPVLTWHTEAFNKLGIKRIGVVRGYEKDAVNLSSLEYFDNDDHDSTGELYSLYQARSFLEGDVVIAYGDVIYDDTILQNLLNDRRAIRIAADAAFRLRERDDDAPDLVRATGEASFVEGGRGPKLERIGHGVTVDNATGDWVGLLALTSEGTETLAKRLDQLANDDEELLKKGSLVELLNLLVEEGHEVGVVHTFGHWRDLDSQANLLESDAAT
jgi:phosphoenolpyruvate phosphomutase